MKKFIKASWPVVTAFAVIFSAALSAAFDDKIADGAGKQSDAKSTKSETPSNAFGVLLNDSRASAGYNLINPGRNQTYLYDNDGRVVHTWTSDQRSGTAAYLLDNGLLFRPCEAANRKGGFQGPAAGGRIQVLDWDGKIVWDFEYHSERRLPHHDAIVLPNGNALLICWERVSENEAVAKGRRPETVKDSHLQPDCLVEIRPTGATTGEIVWEWRSWDHLIQDHDSTRANFGDVAAHPELFDVNYVHGEDDKPAQDKPAQDKQKVEVRKNPDWMHVNAVAYNPELDQIAMSSPHFHEIWIIDHSTTTAEAASHSGGRWGKGGDILYRWGNPRAYRNGSSADQRLFFQHNIQWIPKGLSGEGHLLVFNNGSGRKPEEFSAVDEFVPPTDAKGNYVRPEGGPFGPAEPLWRYIAPNPTEFFSWFISGTQRLPNGNTLINSGAVGVVFEVTPEKEVVWKMVNPFKRPAPPANANANKPKRFEAVDRSSRDGLGLKEDQRKKLDELDNELNTRLEKFLTSDQIRSFSEPNQNDNAIFSKLSPGEYFTAFKRSAPELTDAQRQELEAVQKEFNPKITELLSEEQKKQVAEFKQGQIAAAKAPQGTPRRPGNTLFRVSRYPLNHPAFSGKTLTPGKTLVELEEEFDKQQKESAAAESKKTAATTTK